MKAVICGILGGILGGLGTAAAHWQPWAGALAGAALGVILVTLANGKKRK